MSYTIETIAERISARRVGDTPAIIDWLLTDSRSLSFPEETLFFALTTNAMMAHAIFLTCIHAVFAIL